MATTKKTARKTNTYQPAEWQWDPMSVTAERVQFWSAGGSCRTISLDEARTLVRRKAAFAGSCNHVCQVHDRIVR